MDRPIKVSVACQKGGAGKSTITTLLANKLYFEHGKKVIIVDCNYPQLSLLGLRTMESQRFKKSLENAKQNDDTKIDKDLRLFLRVLEEFPNFMKDFTIRSLRGADAGAAAPAGASDLHPDAGRFFQHRRQKRHSPHGSSSSRGYQRGGL